MCAWVCLSVGGEYMRVGVYMCVGVLSVGGEYICVCVGGCVISEVVSTCVYVWVGVLVRW